MKIKLTCKNHNKWSGESEIVNPYSGAELFREPFLQFKAAALETSKLTVIILFKCPIAIDNVIINTSIRIFESEIRMLIRSNISSNSD